MRTAIFPGTFDPFTIGHDALVHRALSLVDELYIAIGINIGKHTMLTLDERVQRIAALYKECKAEQCCQNIFNESFHQIFDLSRASRNF